MPYCQQFKEKMLEWKEELEKVRVLLGEFQDSGDGEKAEELHKRLEKTSNEQRNFLENEFRPKAVLVIKNCYPFSDEDAWPRIKNMRFDHQGRVSIESYAFLDFDHNRIHYFPNLIRKIDNLALFLGDHIKSLPGLEEAGFLQDTFRLRSYPRLKKVKRATFSIDKQLKSVPELKEVERSLTIQGKGIQNTEELKKVFPKLRKIGQDSDGFSITFPTNYPEHNKLLKSLFEELKDRGDLEFTGKIGIPGID